MDLFPIHLLSRLGTTDQHWIDFMKKTSKINPEFFQIFFSRRLGGVREAEDEEFGANDQCQNSSGG